MVQKTNQNLRVISKFKKKIKKTTHIDKLILFGSRVKGGFSKDSDFDLLIVSDNFKEIPWYKRPVKFYLMWDEDYPLEILCYTPEEIKKSINKIGIVSEAIKSGIEV